MALAATITLLVTCLVPWTGSGLFFGDAAASGHVVVDQAGHAHQSDALISVTITPNGTDVISGQGAQFEAQAVANSPGMSSFTYSWTVGPNAPGGITQDSGSTTTFMASQVSTATSTSLTVTAMAYDELMGFVPVTASATVIVVVIPILVAEPLTASPDPTTPGTHVTLAMTLEGGLPPFNVTWSLGDGSTAKEVVSADGSFHIDHVYEAGSYTPSATAIDSAGESSSTSTLTTLIVSSRLAVTLSAPSQGDVGDSVTVQSSVNGGDPPYSFDWTASSGQSSLSSGSWSVPLLTSGPVGISLAVTDSLGQVASAASITIVSNPPPTLVLGSSLTSTDVGMSFPLALAIDGGTPPYMVTWTDEAEEASFSSTFASPGNYLCPYAFAIPGNVIIEASITDKDGASTSVNELVGKVVPLPSVNLSLYPSTPTVGTTLNVSGIVGHGLPPYTYSFAFSGTVDSYSPLSGSLRGPGVATWSGSVPGASPVLVTMYVTDYGGAETTGSLTISAVTRLEGSLTLSPSLGEVGRPLTATVSTTGGTPPYTFSISGTDGESVTGLAPTPGIRSVQLVPAVAGNITFTLSISDSLGRAIDQQAVVDVAPLLSAQMEWSPWIADVGDHINVTMIPEGGWAPYSGTLSTSAGSIFFVNGFAGRATLPLFFPTQGTFSLTLTISDSMGSTASRTASITINPQPTVTLTVSSQRSEVDVPVTFMISAVGGTPPFTTGVSFGDGTTSSQQDVEHTFLKPGTYLASATLRDSTGNAASSSTISMIVVPLPQVAATVATPFGDVGLGVAFESDVSFGMPPYDFCWSFGDGSTSAEANPTHTYTVAGLYHVTLRITDSMGESASSPVINLTVEPAPALSISANATAIDAGESVSFTATSIGGAPPGTVLWNFGDGSDAQGFTVAHVYESTGNYAVTATLSDSAGGKVTSSETMSVSPPLFPTAVAEDPTMAEVGSALTLSETPIGGVSPFTAVWEIGGTHAAGLGLTTWSLTPTTPGVLSGTLNLTDATGATVRTTFSVRVASPLLINASATPALAEVGLALTLQSSVSGGVGPYTFVWTLPTGQVEGRNLSTLTTYPATAGMLSASVTVTDALGQSLSSLLSVKVAPRLALAIPSTGLAADAGIPFPLPVTMTGGVGTPVISVSTPMGLSPTVNSLVFPDPGTYPISVSAIDADGAIAVVNANVTVNPPLAVSFSTAPHIVAAGVATLFSADIAGGSGGLTERWSVSGVSSWNGGSASITFPEPATYSLEFSASDMAGDEQHIPLNVTAIEDGLNLSLDASSAVGLSPFVPLLSLNLSGGRSPVSIAILQNDQPIVNLSDWNDGVAWTGEADLYEPGTYQVTAIATDSVGKSASATLTLTSCPSLSVPIIDPATPTATAGIPLDLTLRSLNEACGGARSNAVWWGPGLLSHAGDTVTFLKNSSGTTIDHLSLLILLPSGEALENLTVPVVVYVGAGEAVRVREMDPCPIGIAGENLTLSFQAVDAFGNANETYNGSMTLTPLGSEGTSFSATFDEGVAQFSLSSIDATWQNFTVASPLDAPAEVSVRWIANGERVLLKIQSWMTAGNDLYLNVSVTDIYGNPLSNVAVEATASGHSPVWANATGGWVTFTIPGAANASSVTVSGPGGAITTLNLDGPTSDPGMDTLSICLSGLLVLTVLAFVLLWWKRRKGTTPPPADGSQKTMTELLKKWPGEDTDSLLAMAEEEKIGRDEARNTLSAMEKAGLVEHFSDEEGVERWRAPVPKEVGK